MKSPLESFVSRLGRFAVVALFGLSAAFAAAQEGRSTVVSMSPAGSSTLNWKKPASKTSSASDVKAGFLTLTDPDESPAEEAAEEKAVEEKAAESKILPIAETIPAEKDQASPIRPVRLLQLETPQAAVPEVKPVQVAQVSDGFGTTAPLPPSHPTAQIPRNQNEDAGYVEECPDPKSLASIKDLSYKVTLEPGLFPESCPLPDEVYYREAPTPITFTWKASALCHKPLYFEDVQLERYGHSCCPILQPVCSGVRFWLTIPILPYLMGTYPPNECIYDLGYYRPGSCAPHMLQPIPISLRGGLIEAGSIVGFFYIFP